MVIGIADGLIVTENHADSLAAIWGKSACVQLSMEAPVKSRDSNNSSSCHAVTISCEESDVADVDAGLTDARLLNFFVI